MADRQDGGPAGHRGSRRGRPRRAGADAAALRAAVELVAERGYSGTTIDGIASRAGVAKTTLYRRWDSKGELAVEALAAELGEPPVPGGVADDSLHAAVSWLARRVSDPGARLLLVGLSAEAARDPQTRAALRGRIREPFTRRLADRWGLARERVDLAFDVVVGTLLHRVAVTGSIDTEDVDVVTQLATRLLFPT